MLGKSIDTGDLFSFSGENMNININDLTIGQVKEISGMLNSSTPTKTNLYERYIGKPVLVRSRNEGVNFGFVVAVDETGVILKDARRLWYHKPADTSQSWYEGVANTGLSSDSKIAPPVGEKAIIENYSITTCNICAVKSITEAPSHEQ